MSLTDEELFQQGKPISRLFPLRASNGIMIEEHDFKCSYCEVKIPKINVRGFFIHKGDIAFSHLFCKCQQCREITVLSDAYEERLFGVALWEKRGAEWLHIHDIDIPYRYRPKILMNYLNLWMRKLLRLEAHKY